MKPLPNLCVCAVLLLTAWACSAKAVPPREAQAASVPGEQPFYFAIPAPRGQILDCQGKPLARTKVVQRLVLRVPPLKRENADEYAAWVHDYWPKVTAVFADATLPGDDLLKQQFEFRRRIPLVVSDVISDSELLAKVKDAEFLDVQNEYAREYPNGTLAAHVIGYVTADGAPLRGPLLYGEPLWRNVAGRSGLEASMNAELTGADGLEVVCYDKEGRVTQRQILKQPMPGHDVVTTLQVELQQSVEQALKSAGRPGSMVVVDVSTGSILAMASNPTFDPNVFVSGLNKGAFARITSDKDQPLFNRAISGLYPPGSVFKPFVALAGMRSGRLDPDELVPCGPELLIDGRRFQNWSKNDNGLFDLRGAIVRSFNTYFYQAAIRIGDQPILTTAREFGFGTPKDLPLSGVAKGELPKKVPSNQGLANMSIGQSPLLATPLEVSMAMAAIADGLQRPKARLVSQVQDQDGNVTASTPPAQANPIRYPTEAMVTLHDAMYGVVNHVNGTAAKARVPGLRVYGKTGTAQWSHNGDMVNAVWFAGFIKDSDPPLAFAVSMEGRKGETIFGGSTAAPVAAQVLKAIAKKPAQYALQLRPVKAPQVDYTLAYNPDIPVPYDYYLNPVQQTVASGVVGGADYGATYPGSVGDDYVEVRRPYDASAWPPDTTIIEQPQMPGGVVVLRRRGVPEPEVPRAVPVREAVAPTYYYSQPQSVNSYDRSRFTASDNRRFLFPSRR